MIIIMDLACKLQKWSQEGGEGGWKPGSSALRIILLQGECCLNQEERSIGNCDLRAEHLWFRCGDGATSDGLISVVIREKVPEVSGRTRSSEIRRSRPWASVKLGGSSWSMMKCQSWLELYDKGGRAHSEITCEPQDMAKKWEAAAPERYWGQNSKSCKRPIKRQSWGENGAVGGQEVKFLYLLDLKYMK